MSAPSLKDAFGREISYLRLSVTDRCDLRCAYCMAEDMKFLPKRDVLSLEELEFLAAAFIDRGVKKIRLTGGEPLVRRDIMSLINRLGARFEANELEELTITTNATQLERFAGDLFAAGVRRVNVSLDTLDDENFFRLTRRRQLGAVIRGIDAAQRAGLKVKINTVALKDTNQSEIPAMIEWAHGRDMTLTLIEVMPLGEIEQDRFDQYLPLSAVSDDLKSRWTLEPLEMKTGGPARYWRIIETGGVLGMITPLTNNFCAGCNRVRVTCTGEIYMCLGHGDKLDLRAALRGPNPTQTLNELLDVAMRRKPERHEFEISKPGAEPAVARHMSVTGG
ncbi:MAG: GTP 3',8-cyclase MoaA [Marinicaulis sp.]|nr:GTP 3',8-cyclase MoaA [Marinicaulis sp.]NNE40927.1 GTP 3',8-cyclase MoaA [Marinicaulis sp.]NNL89210.1 GTP 3',8-cyclase MoaA [Marinicaulis sp.]